MRNPSTGRTIVVGLIAIALIAGGVYAYQRTRNSSAVAVPTDPQTLLAVNSQVIDATGNTVTVRSMVYPDVVLTVAFTDATTYGKTQPDGTVSDELPFDFVIGDIVTVPALHVADTGLIEVDQVVLVQAFPGGRP